MRIIDNKKIDLTPDEWEMYQSIVKSYTTSTNKGEDLFYDLFETNDDGIIIYLRPPSKRYTSLEVFLFLVSVFNQQHMRILYNQVNDLSNQIKLKMNELESKKAK